MGTVEKVKIDPSNWWNQSLEGRLESLLDYPESADYGPARPSDKAMEMARLFVQALKDPHGPYVITSSGDNCDAIILFEWFLPNGKHVTIGVEHGDIDEMEYILDGHAG